MEQAGREGGKAWRDGDEELSKPRERERTTTTKQENGSMAWSRKGLSRETAKEWEEGGREERQMRGCRGNGHVHCTYRAPPTLRSSLIMIYSPHRINGKVWNDACSHYPDTTRINKICHGMRDDLCCLCQYFEIEHFRFGLGKLMKGYFNDSSPNVFIIVYCVKHILIVFHY